MDLSGGQLKGSPKAKFPMFSVVKLYDWDLSIVSSEVEIAPLQLLHQQVNIW